MIIGGEALVGAGQEIDLSSGDAAGWVGRRDADPQATHRATTSTSRT
jgi:hypothetical protein